MTTEVANDAGGFATTTFYGNGVTYKNIGDLFKKIKEKGICAEIIKLNMQDFPSPELLNTEFIIDKIHYYRVLQKVSIREMGKAAGIFEDRYSLYENHKIPLLKLKEVEIFLKKLNIEDKVEIPEFIKFIDEYPGQEVYKYLKNNNIPTSEFSRKTGISWSTVTCWKKSKGNIKISPESYRKLYEYWKKYCNYNTSK